MTSQTRNPSNEPSRQSGRATIRDVAAAAGVSMGTVSRVAAGNPRISDATRSKVLEAMKALAYQPNAAARAMRTNVSKTVGLLIPDIGCPIFNSVVQGADEVLSAHGYMLFAHSSNRRPDREIAFLQAARQRQMDGLIVSIADENSAETVRELELTGAPLVILDRDVPVDADVVFNEHRNAMATVVDHLVALGHERIALITVPQGIRPGRERVIGYRQALEKAGIAYDDNLVRAYGQGDDYGAAEAHDLLVSPEPPTALIAAGSDVFYGALRTVRALGLAIPDDLSFVAADDSEIGEIAGPAITMIDRDMREAGRQAARLLLQRFDGLSLPPRKILLNSTIILRNSAGPVPKPARPAVRTVDA